MVKIDPDTLRPIPPSAEKDIDVQPSKPWPRPEVKPTHETQSALAVQEGGDHYKSMVIQPIEFIHANSIPFAEGSVIKYVTRHRNKNKEQDIRKAIHFCKLILKLEYGQDE